MTDTHCLSSVVQQHHLLPPLPLRVAHPNPSLLPSTKPTSKKKKTATILVSSSLVIFPSNPKTRLVISSPLRWSCGFPKTTEIKDRRKSSLASSSFSSLASSLGGVD
jgi:hypothetical protein